MNRALTGMAAKMAQGCLLTACVVILASHAAAQQRPAGAAGNVANGKKVFAAQKCDGCHGPNAEGGAGDVAGPQIGPPPMALPVFIETVRSPKDPMPAFTAKEVSDADLTDLYAYLKSLGGASSAPAGAAPAAASATAGHAGNGKQVYMRAGCFECHDIEGQGGAGTGPRLAPPIAYSGFLRQVRSPSDQMPPYTAKVLSDNEVADIYAYLQSVPKPPALASIPLLK